MLGHEGRYEIIAVVVAALTPQRQRNAGFVAGALEQLGTELLLEELVGGADIDQQVLHPSAVLDQCDGVMPAPGGAVIAEIAAKSLLSPRHPAGRNDRSERRDASEPLGEVERDGERAVATHRMAGDPLPVHVDRKFARDERRKLLRHIAPHAVVPGPGLLSRVDVEARTLAEVIAS